MQIPVFFTDDGRSPQGSGPTLVIEDSPSPILSHNPRSLEWRYMATMESADALFRSEASRLRTALARGRAFITNRLS